MAEYGVMCWMGRTEAEILGKVTESYEGTRDILAEQGKVLSPMRLIEKKTIYPFMSVWGWVANA